MGYYLGQFVPSAGWPPTVGQEFTRGWLGNYLYNQYPNVAQVLEDFDNTPIGGILKLSYAGWDVNLRMSFSNVIGAFRAATEFKKATVVDVSRSTSEISLQPPPPPPTLIPVTQPVPTPAPPIPPVPTVTPTSLLPPPPVPVVVPVAPGPESCSPPYTWDPVTSTCRFDAPPPQEIDTAVTIQTVAAQACAGRVMTDDDLVDFFRGLGYAAPEAAAMRLINQNLSVGENRTINGAHGEVAVITNLAPHSWCLVSLSHPPEVAPIPGGEPVATPIKIMSMPVIKPPTGNGGGLLPPGISPGITATVTTPALKPPPVVTPIVTSAEPPTTITPIVTPAEPLTRVTPIVTPAEPLTRVTPAPESAAPVWLDQELIAGVKNKWLALGVLGAFFLLNQKGE